MAFGQRGQDDWNPASALLSWVASTQRKGNIINPSESRNKPVTKGQIETSLGTCRDWFLEPHQQRHPLVLYWESSIYIACKHQSESPHYLTQSKCCGNSSHTRLTWEWGDSKSVHLFKGDAAFLLSTLKLVHNEAIQQVGMDRWLHCRTLPPGGTHNSETYKDGNGHRDPPQVWGGEMEHHYHLAERNLSWEDENILQRDGRDGCSHLNILNASEWHTLE